MIDLAGGQLGAFTTREYTCLFAAVLDDYRTYALDIFGDVLLHPTFETESLSREQEVIFQELEAGEERPDKLSQETLKKNVWAGHPLGQRIYGERTSVSSFTRQQVLDFFADYYGADRIIVAAAGNLDHDDFAAQANDALWALPVSRKTPGRQSVTEPEFKGAVVLRHRESAHVYFSLGAPAPHYTSKQRYSAYVLNNLLGGGMSSRLYQKTRGEKGLVYDISSSYHPYRSAGMFLVEGFTTPRNMLPVLQETVETLIDLASSPVSEEELWRAKERLRGEILLGAEASNNRMSQIGTQELYFGKYIPTEELVRDIRAVTAEDIMQLAEEMFQPGQLGVAAAGAVPGEGEIQNYIEAMIGL
jgi:predicted Zn-dependent peptidase